MKIAVVGGAGFVGQRLAEVFRMRGVDYQLFDKKHSAPEVDYVDVTVPISLSVISGYDVIVNLAAEHRDDVEPISLYDLVNVEGARNVCEQARISGVNCLVFTSSVAVYGFAPEGTDESGDFDYFNDYGRSKYQAEAVYNEWYREAPEERSLIVIRPTVIFGEGNRGNVYNLMKQVANRRFLMIGSGENRKSMAYVDNVASFIEFSTRLEPGNHVFNYVDKPDLTMNELVTTIRSGLLGGNGVGFRVPGWFGVLVGSMFDILAYVLRRKLPISKIRIEKFMATTSFNSSVDSTGFSAHVPLREGIQRTLECEFAATRNDTQAKDSV